jgi:hypothetical protein
MTTEPGNAPDIYIRSDHSLGIAVGYHWVRNADGSHAIAFYNGTHWFCCGVAWPQDITKDQILKHLEPLRN